MAEFGAAATLEVEVDRQSLADAKSEIEGEIGTVTASASSSGGGQTITDGGGLAAAAAVDDLVDIGSEQVDILEDILDEVEDGGGVGGGSGGGGGLFGGAGDFLTGGLAARGLGASGLASRFGRVGRIGGPAAAGAFELADLPSNLEDADLGGATEDIFAATGAAGGTIGGAKAGGAAGSFFGPGGALAGSIIGGGIGALGGSELGTRTAGGLENLSDDLEGAFDTIDENAIGDTPATVTPSGTSASGSQNASDLMGADDTNTEFDDPTLQRIANGEQSLDGSGGGSSGIEFGLPGFGGAFQTTIGGDEQSGRQSQRDSGQGGQQQEVNVDVTVRNELQNELDLSELPRGIEQQLNGLEGTIIDQVVDQIQRGLQ